MPIVDQLTLCTGLYRQKREKSKSNERCLRILFSEEWPSELTFLFQVIYLIYLRINMSARKVTQKMSWWESKVLIMRSSNFQWYTVGQQPAPARGLSPQLLFVLQSLLGEQQWLGGRALGKGGGVWSTTRRNKHISAQITTPTYTVPRSASDWTEVSETNDSTEGIRSLLEVSRGLFVMTQHWKHNSYRWFVHTAYIAYLILGQSGKMSCIKSWKFIGAFFL